MSHGSWRGLPRGARADAEIAPGAGAWCAPARTANMLGLGADERRFGSRAQVNLAMGVPNVAGWPHSGARRCGVRHPSRTCGESSIPSLSNYSDDLHFACRAQVARSSSTRGEVARPPLGVARGHLLPQVAAADGLLRHARLPRAWGVAVDAWEGGRPHGCDARWRPSGLLGWGRERRIRKTRRVNVGYEMQRNSRIREKIPYGFPM